MRSPSIPNLVCFFGILSISVLAACGDGTDEGVSPVEIMAQDPEPEMEIDPIDETEPEPEPEPEPEIERGPAELFGASLDDDVQFVPFEELISDPETYADQLIQTEGTIRGVCQRRGCWMEIRSMEDPAGETVNVRFLDYGFFVPLDSRGALVRVQGTPAVQTLSAEEVQELLAEGYDPGIVREDGTAILIRFTASGVLMWNRGD